MAYLTLNIVYNGKVVFLVAMVILMAFFISMDTHLYFTLQSTKLVNQDPPIPGKYSPFKPLSIKLLMTDPCNQYIIGPSAEYFDEVTGFSKVLYFITPNMISFTHVLISFISAKFVSSENLCTRRGGVILYQFRSWLDDLDGVVYRSHTQTKGKYQSNHNTLGYYVDIYSDIVGGVALSFGILFYLWKCPPSSNGNKNYTPLPTKASNSGSSSPVPSISPTRKFDFNLLNINVFSPNDRQNGSGPLTKRQIFFKVLCFGCLMAIAGGTWDKVVEKYSDVFQTDLEDMALTIDYNSCGKTVSYLDRILSSTGEEIPGTWIGALTAQIQTEALHSGSTWLVIYIWRMWEGQALLQMVLLAVFIDRIWEFLNFFQYLGYIIVMVVNIISYIHLNHVHKELGM